MSLIDSVLDESISHDFDVSVYSLDLIQKACLKHSDLASFDFKLLNQSVHLTITPAKDTGVNASQILYIIKNEVLDQALREKISRETEMERNLILSYAFSNSLLVKN